MNLTLSKRADYVVRSALSLARAYESGESRKIREVVAEMDVPATFASQILSDLVRAGLATSKAGKSGGYRLARRPEEVRLIDLVEAAEGPLRAERCALGDGPCRWGEVCPLHETWQEASAALREVLARTSLADVVARDRALEAGTYPAPSDSHRHSPRQFALRDTVQVELPLAVVVAELEAAPSWISARAAAAAQAADSLRRAIDPTGPDWLGGVRPSVRLARTDVTPRPSEPVVGRKPTEVARIESPAVASRAVEAGEVTGARFHLDWDATSARELSSRLEADLDVIALDGSRVEVRAAAVVRPPVDVAGSDALFERIARMLLREFLRQLARELEAVRQAEESHGRTAGHVVRHVAG
jgi:Rrf2 family protein